MRFPVLGLVIVVCVSALAFAQSPSVVEVVNAASFTTPVTPGSVASIFGSNLASGIKMYAISTFPCLHRKPFALLTFQRVLSYKVPRECCWW